MHPLELSSDTTFSDPEVFSNPEVYTSGSQTLGCTGIAWRACEKHRLPEPTLKLSGSANLGWRLRTCISNMCPGDSDVAGLATTF